MPEEILMEEFHVTVTARRGLRDADYGRIRRTLIGRRFRSELRRAVREVVRLFPALGKCKVRLTR